MERMKFESIDSLIENTPNKYKNHRADDDDIKKMTCWVSLLSKFLKTKSVLLSELETQTMQRFILPVEIQILYSTIGKDINRLNVETLKLQKFQLLNIEDFWVEKDVTIRDYYTEEIWFKTDVLVCVTAKNKKNPIYGIDLRNGWGLSYQKKWFWQKDDMPIFQKLTTLYTNVIISNKENIMKTKLKGVTGIKRDMKAESNFSGTIMRLPEFEYYEHAIFFNIDIDLVGWFRAGNTPDLLLASDVKANLDKVISKFNLTKAKFLKSLF